jgi:hypothetical protein
LTVVRAFCTISGMTSYLTFRSVIDECAERLSGERGRGRRGWVCVFARAINARPNTVWSWYTRDKIPSRYWSDIETLASSLGCSVNVSSLQRIERMRKASSTENVHRADNFEMCA